MKKTFVVRITLLFVFLLSVFTSRAQIWFREGFDVALAPTDTTPVGWTQGFVSGSALTFPNGFKRFTTSVNPATVPAGGYSASTGMIKYNQRSIAYPTASGSAAGNSAILVSPPLDWSGRTGASTGWASFRFWRDNSLTGGVQNVSDSIQVFINTRPDLVGALLLTESASSSTKIPRSTYLAPQSIPNTTALWQLEQYALPAFGSYTTIDTSSSVFLIIKAMSAGGNNMYIDSVNFPTYPTPMALQGAEIFYQETADLGKGTTDNLIIGVRIWAHGSTTPQTIDSMLFIPNGSTSPLTDISAAKLWYTGSNTSFSSATQYDVTTTVSNLSFGYGNGTCAAWSVTTPVGFQCKPGWNYFWLTYDIAAGATSGDFVDADFIGYNGSAAVPPPACATFRTVNLSAVGRRQIDIPYPSPTYVFGTGISFDFFIFHFFFPGSFISAVETDDGINSTDIDNWYHDVNLCGNPVPPANCDRFSPHPPDYTKFPPQDNGFHKKRYAQVNAGQGIRSGTTAFVVRAAPGGSNASNIAVFIDWNKDGDFYDQYDNGVLPGGTIFESYGTQVLGVGTPANPFGSSFGSWILNVPDKTDIVTNINGGAGANMSGGNLLIGNVRMRVRQSVGNNPISPVQNGYIYGETEDYIVQVLDVCPSPSANICIWLGNTTDWDDIQNWCPAIPTINDMAYVPVSATPLVYPVIDEGTIAVCRTLKIVDGAKVTIDCPKNGSLTVSDSLIIGVGTINSTSSLVVNSTFKKTVTIPAPTSVPPAGFGLNTLTPFKTNQNSKFQIAYSATELSSIYGLKGGDMVDSLIFLIKTLTPGATDTFPRVGGGFRIRAYFLDTTVVFPIALVSGTSVGIRPASPHVIWSDTIYSSYPGNVKLIINNTTTTLPVKLIPGKLIWDGTSNLVLSFEYYGNAGNPSSAQLYCELGSSYQTFYATCLTGAIGYQQNQSGYNIDGVQASNGVALPCPCPPTPTIAAATSSYRPRIDFVFHRPYTRFPITVGKAFVNNSTLGTPPGADGWIAGNSKVIFDPSTRLTVISPGLFLFSGSIFNPTSQSIFLFPDTAKVASGINPDPTGSTYTFGSSYVKFNEVEVKAYTIGAHGIMQPDLNVFADTLTMTSGELRLNKKTFTIVNPNGSSLASNGGWIRSEDTNAVVQSIISWLIGTNTSAHVIPFGKNVNSIFPLSLYHVTNVDLGQVDFATYGTGTVNNTPFPITPVLVKSMNTNPSPVLDATPWTVDRFWYIKRSTTTTLSSNDSIILSYEDAIDGTSASAYSAGNMKAQRYARDNSTTNWGWMDPALFASQRDFQTSGIVSVKAVANNYLGLETDSGFIWTIVNLTTNAPLPVELLSFNAKRVDEKVRIWWDVQSENNVADYIVHRTVNNASYDFIAQQPAKGPSAGILNYEDWDYAPLKGLQYYRLQTNLLDGNVKYSQLVPVKFETKDPFVITHVEVNGTGSSIKVDFVYDSNLPYNYMLTDALGKVYVSGYNVGYFGNNSFEIPSNLVTGIYTISIRNSEKTVSAKLKY